MARRLIRRYLPDVDQIRKHKHLRFFGKLLHDPNLWHLNRESVAKAFAIGLFMAFMPIPLQMIPAAALAIYFRANVAIAVALCWITNPLTLAPATYACYWVGARLLNTPPHAFDFEPSWTWISEEFARVWQPYLLGSFVVAGALALIGYHGMYWLWRWHVVRAWERRNKQRRHGAKRRNR